MLKPYEKILCPIDFEPNSAMALKRAAMMVQRHGGTLTVAHIISNPLSEIYRERILEAWGTQEDIERACMEKPFSGFSTVVLDVAKVMIKAFVREHIGDISYEMFIALDEHTYRAINDYAEEKGIDLIVMATHGRTGPKRLYFGSVAENIVRRSPCSVLIVRS
ncbi:MAG: universal stress protein [Desulfobacterales bacterium]|jgi:nucleotide-binding universal stress UspA family protein|nr:universal stress protein [Desulfobacterales bacterium]